MKYKNIREEELKNKVGADWFKGFDTTEIIGNIDFTVFPKQNQSFGRTPLLWAEAKTGNFDVVAMFVQLILTIGKARTFDKTMPPAFLGAFDFVKIAFVPYSSVQDIFYLNDFNWNVTPSQHDSKEFQLIKERIEATLHQNAYTYDYLADAKELEAFIKNNIANASTTSKLKIDKNNFIPIYLRWLEMVKPIIQVDWDALKKANILDSDFYLADLFVDDKDTASIDDDTSLRDSLFVVFQNQGYKIAKENLRQMFDATIGLKDKDAYTQFWKRYKRPPLKEFQDYIIERRDLLVPQDIRERKGAFFTPRKWVELSQKYITDYLGENWQDDYYIWDCAAGTGNLLAGLTNKYHIYASTLDQADVNVIHERIDHGANLLKGNVFQFDFLNDEFTPISKGGKMPEDLYKIINDEEKRKKLVVYINPPYAEVSSKAEQGKVGVNQTKVHEKYSNILGTAGRELFAQFLIRIYKEIKGCIISNFSTLKIFNGSAFQSFRNNFKAEFQNGFIVPANTFDNVKGEFPIGFNIWNTYFNSNTDEIQIDIYDKKEDFIGTKIFFFSHDKSEYINKYIAVYKVTNENNVGYMDGINGNDFAHNNIVYIINTKEQLPNPRGIWINKHNLIPIAIYFTVRKLFTHTWINHNDQFLNPNEKWKSDIEFQNDCFTFLLFHEKNNLQSKFGVNHWIPFTEREVDAQAKFESHFMTDFIQGKIQVESKETQDLFSTPSSATPPKSQQSSQALTFSPEATAVFDAGRALWKYYHTQKFPATFSSSEGVTEGRGGYNPNASLYDIREYFQGRNDKGRMNTKSNDATYMKLISDLRNQLAILAEKIQPKVYEYGFLKG